MTTLTRVQKRLTQEDKRAIYDAYVAAGRRNIEGLLERFDISRTTLYTIRDEFENFSVPVVQQGSVGRAPDLDLDLPDALLQTMAQQALRTLLQSYAELRNENTALRAENERLKGAMAPRAV